MGRRKWSIAIVIILVLTFTISCILWIFASAVIRYEGSQSRAQLNTKMGIYTEQLSKVLSIPLWNLDNSLLTEIAKNYMLDEDLFAIAIKEPDKLKYTCIIARNTRWEAINSVSIPLHSYNVVRHTKIISYHTKTIGEVTVYSTDKFTMEKVHNKSTLIISGCLLLEIVLVGGLYFMLWQIVIRPVKIISRYSKTVAESEHQAVPIRFSTHLGEISSLYEAISQMVEILYRRHLNYRIAGQKYRSLFEKSPVAILLEDVSEVITYFNELKEKGISNLKIYLSQHADESDVLAYKIKIIEANLAASILFDVSGEHEIINCSNQKFKELFFPFYKETFELLWEGNASFQCETEIRTISGRFRYVIARWNIIEISDDTRYMLVSITDITDRKNVELMLVENERELKFKNEEYFTLNEELSESNERILKINEELVKAKEKAEESDNLKSAFLDNLSHEIRTPLNAIIGFSDLLLEKGSIDTKTNGYISIIQLSSQQLLAIVSDVLTISRIQTGQETMCVNPVTLGTLFDSIYEGYKEMASKKSLSLILNKDHDFSGLQILTDEVKFSSILGAFLSNAIKFTQMGQVELGYEVKERFLVIYVKDSGIGITKEDIPYIFDRFRQANKDISVNYGGTGLGLSIAKAYADMLGGNISVTSRISKGSTFTFTMPFISYTEPRKIASGFGSDVDNHQKTILVAEDEYYNYQLIESMLEEQNIKLLKATNGSEALEICRSDDTIDLVLMDIKMPVMDGVSAFNEIRKLKKNLPVIAQTAYDAEHEKLHLIQKGFNDFITKPISKKKLLETINRYTK